MEQILTEEHVKRTIDETLHTLDRIGQGYRRGFITQTDCFYTMLGEFSDGFWAFLRNNGLQIRINSDNYGAFSKEYLAYIKEKDVFEKDHKPWFFKLSNGAEASKEDQKLVMYMMLQYCLAPEFFEPEPEDITDPGRVYAHGWHNGTAYGITFRCVDDGGLLTDEDTAGKSYRLVNDLGLEAVITVKEDRRNTERRGLDFDELIEASENGMQVMLAHFLAEGYIEGYTAKERKENPDIIIRLNGKGKVYRLAYYASPEDEKVYKDFPLWQDHFKWSDEKAVRDKEILSVLFYKYIIPPEDMQE